MMMYSLPFYRIKGIVRPYLMTDYPFKYLDALIPVRLTSHIKTITAFECMLPFDLSRTIPKFLCNPFKLALVAYFNMYGL
jgi:hypothetical protein